MSAMHHRCACTQVPPKLTPKVNNPSESNSSTWLVLYQYYMDSCCSNSNNNNHLSRANTCRCWTGWWLLLLLPGLPTTVFLFDIRNRWSLSYLVATCHLDTMCEGRTSWGRLLLAWLKLVVCQQGIENAISQSQCSQYLTILILADNLVLSFSVDDGHHQQQVSLTILAHEKIVWIVY